MRVNHNKTPEGWQREKAMFRQHNRRYHAARDLVVVGVVVGLPKAAGSAACHSRSHVGPTHATMRTAKRVVW